METFPIPTTFTEEKATKTEGTFVLEPCYPGYGVTLGNALRRVLLSSLPGAAITSAKIDGVDHEFTAIEGVKEDAVNILLNIKMIRLRLIGADRATLQLKAKGKGAVTAKDFEKNAQVEVTNPDAVIATLTNDASVLTMECTVENGRGYVPVETREDEEMEIGRIAVDAIFSPVRVVNYDATHVRVGKMTNFDRLTLHIVTDGSITPREALSHAAQVLVDHFSILTAGENAEPRELKPTKAAKKSDKAKNDTESAS